MNDEDLKRDEKIDHRNRYDFGKKTLGVRYPSNPAAGLMKRSWSGLE